MMDSSHNWRNNQFRSSHDDNNSEDNVAEVAPLEDFHSLWNREGADLSSTKRGDFTYPGRTHDPRDDPYYKTESAPASTLQPKPLLMTSQGDSSDLAVSDFNVAQGIFKKKGRALKFTIDEFYDSCFSITFMVQETGQKWVVFIPPPEDILVLRHLWGTAKSSEYHEKVCSWLLESVVLEFNGNSIKHAQFDFAALHDICLNEMEGYIIKGSPYKSGIAKDIKNEILERQKIRSGIKNAKLRSSANHKEYQNYGNGQREFPAATPPVMAGREDSLGLFTIPTGTEESTWEQSLHGPSQSFKGSVLEASERSVAGNGSGQAFNQNKMMSKLISLPPELQSSPYMPSQSKPSTSRQKSGRANKRLQKLKLRAAAGEELDAIQETVQNVLSEVQGRLNRLRECVISTTAETPATSGGDLTDGLHGVEATEPPLPGAQGRYDLSSPATGDVISNRGRSDTSKMVIHEDNESEDSPTNQDKTKQYRDGIAMPPRGQAPQGQFRRKDVAPQVEQIPTKKRTLDSGDTPRPPLRQWDHSPINSSYGVVHLSDTQVHLSAPKKRSGGSVSPEKQRGRSKSPDSGKKMKTLPKSENDSSPSKTAANNQQADILSSVLAKVAILEREIADQKKINVSLKNTVLEEINKAKLTAIEDITKASDTVAQSKLNTGLPDASVSLYGSQDDSSLFEASATIAESPPAQSTVSIDYPFVQRPISDSPGSKNLRGRSQLMLTNTSQALDELIESLWKAIAKKEEQKIRSYLQEMNVIFPSQQDMQAALQNLSTPIYTCIRSFHKSNKDIFHLCLDFINRVCAESNWTGSGAVASISSVRTDENAKFQSVFGESGLCNLLIDIAADHGDTATDCTTILRIILALTGGHAENRSRLGKKKLVVILNKMAEDFITDEKMLALWSRLVAELSTRNNANQNLFYETNLTEKLVFCIKVHSNHSKVMMNLCKAAALLCTGSHKGNQGVLGSKENCDFYTSILKSSSYSAVVVESMLVIILGVIENNDLALSNFRQCDMATTLCDMLTTESLGPSVHKLTLWFISLLCSDSEILLELQSNAPLKDSLLRLSKGAFTEELQKLATVCSRRITVPSRANTAEDGTRSGSRPRTTDNVIPFKNGESRVQSAAIPEGNGDNAIGINVTSAQLTSQNLSHNTQSKKDVTTEAVVAINHADGKESGKEATTTVHTRENTPTTPRLTESSGKKARQHIGEETSEKSEGGDIKDTNKTTYAAPKIGTPPVSTDSNLKPENAALSSVQPQAVSSDRATSSQSKVEEIKEKPLSALMRVASPSSTNHVVKTGSATIAPASASSGHSTPKENKLESSPNSANVSSRVGSSTSKPASASKGISVHPLDEKPFSAAPEPALSLPKSGVKSSNSGARTGSAESRVLTGPQNNTANAAVSAFSLSDRPASNTVGTADSMRVPSTTENLPNKPSTPLADAPNQSVLFETKTVGSEENINPSDYAEFGFAETIPEVGMQEIENVSDPHENIELQSNMNVDPPEGKRKKTKNKVAVNGDEPSDHKHHKRRKSEAGEKKKKKRKDVEVSDTKLPPLAEGPENRAETYVGEKPRSVPFSATRDAQLSADPARSANKAEGCDSLISAIKLMSANQDVEGMKALLMGAPKILEVEKNMSKFIDELAVCLIEAMDVFMSDVDAVVLIIMICCGCCTPRNEGVYTEGQNALITAGIGQHLVVVAKNHISSSNCAISILKTLAMLVMNNAESKASLSIQPVITILSAIIDSHNSSSSIVTMWSRLICELCDGFPQNQDLLTANHTGTRILKCAKKHQKNDKTITALCKAVTRLCKDSHAMCQGELGTDAAAKLWMLLLNVGALVPELQESRLRALFCVISDNAAVRINFRNKGLANIIGKVLESEETSEPAQQLALCIIFDSANDNLIAAEYRSNAVISKLDELVQQKPKASEATKKYVSLCMEKLFNRA